MLTDVYATVLDLAGLEPDPAAERSRSLLGAPAPADRPVIAEYSGPSPMLRNKLRAVAPELEAPFLTTAYLTVRVGGLRLTLGSDGSSELQDLSEEPMPPEELARRREELTTTLGRLLPGCSSYGAGTNLRTDPELEARLRSLGYLS